jgi:serine protease Do
VHVTYSALSQPGQTLPALYKKVKHSVVSVQTFVCENKQRSWRVGSGFIYNNDGFVVTTSNVIEKGDSISVSLYDGRQLPAWVIYNDARTEVALIRISETNLSGIQFGASKRLSVDSDVSLLGNSLGVFPSLTLGMYRGIGENGLLQLEMAVAPGNCGSPVLDGSGYAVGILMGRALTAIDEGGQVSEHPRFGLALPIESLRSVIDVALKQLAAHKGYIGITVKPLQNCEQNWLVVTGVDNNSPADRAGICKGDTIIGYQGRPIHSQSKLAESVRSLSPNDEAQFLIKKGAGETHFKVRVREKKWTGRRKIR